MKSQALSHGVPMLPNYSFDQSIAAVIDLVMERATVRAAEIHAAEAANAEAMAAATMERHQKRGEVRMRLFLDTADIEEIREINRWGVLSGVTTNPSLVAKEGEDPDSSGRRSWRRSTATSPWRPPSPRPTRCTNKGWAWRRRRQRGREGADDGRGLAAGKRLVDDGIKINVTLVFSPAQAILAAEIGAYIVSPFLGRLDDVGSDGMGMLRAICEIYAVQGYTTNVLAASLRHPMHVVESALAGADIATMPYDVFTKLVKHPLTDHGLEKFQADWLTLQNDLKGEA